MVFLLNKALARPIEDFLTLTYADDAAAQPFDEVQIVRAEQEAHALCSAMPQQGLQALNALQVQAQRWLIQQRQRHPNSNKQKTQKSIKCFPWKN